MFRGIVIVLFGLIACLVLAYEVAAQQTASAGGQPAAGGGRGPAVAPPPPLFFKETWRLMDPPSCDCTW